MTYRTRTPDQIEANRIDLELFRLAVAAANRAASHGLDPKWRRLHSAILATRGCLGGLMHPDDAKELK